MTAQGPQVSMFGWPQTLPTRLACLYCSTSRRTLLRAVEVGVLSPVGKRGRTFLFDRADLDAWGRGAPSAPVAAAPPKQYRTSESQRDVKAALAKLRRLSRS